MLDLLFDEQSEPVCFISASVRILYSILNIDLSNSPHHNGRVVKYENFYPFSNPEYRNTIEMKVAVPHKLHLIALLTLLLSTLLKCSLHSSMHSYM